MLIELDKLMSGWIGVAVEITDVEIDRPVELLLALKNESVGSFHVRPTSFDMPPSISDIEFCLGSGIDSTHSIE